MSALLKSATNTLRTCIWQMRTVATTPALRIKESEYNQLIK